MLITNRLARLVSILNGRGLLASATLAGRLIKRATYKYEPGWASDSSTEEAAADSVPVPRLTILVHPDAMYEVCAWNTDEEPDDMVHRKPFDDYKSLIESKCNEFGTIYVHRIYSDTFPSTIRGARLEFYKEVRSFFDGIADVSVFDRPSFEGTFRKQTLDWIIDNHCGEIVIGGGYTNLCVKQTHEHLEQLLGDLIEEQNINTRIESSICFDRNVKKADRKNLQPIYKRA